MSEPVHCGRDDCNYILCKRQQADLNTNERLILRMSGELYRLHRIEEAMREIARYELGSKHIGEEAVRLKQIARAALEKEA